MREGKKKNVMIYLDPKVVEESRELGLNISKVSENALKEAIRRLKGENCQNILNSQLSDDFSSESGSPGEIRTPV
ncbi:MAG: type II toxin-antitoxin system CcdA family antitoxin [Candidatus Bathyarchaeia archaeon]